LIFAFPALEFSHKKHEFEVLQGSVDVLFRWGGKHLCGKCGILWQIYSGQ